ncbi:hypothetical protein D9M72_471960 [compost metagenome]
MQGRHLGHVDDHVRVQNSHVGRLPQPVHEGLELRTRECTELLVGTFAEPDEPRTESVPPVRQLADVAQRDQGAQQAVDRGKRQVGGGRQLAERDVSAGVSDQFQKFEDALNGLHASRGFFSHNRGLLRYRFRQLLSTS